MLSAVNISSQISQKGSNRPGKRGHETASLYILTPYSAFISVLLPAPQSFFFLLSFFERIEKNNDILISFFQKFIYASFASFFQVVSLRLGGVKLTDRLSLTCCSNCHHSTKLLSPARQEVQLSGEPRFIMK